PWGIKRNRFIRSFCNTLCILSGQSTNFVLLKSPLAGAECTNFLYAQPLIASGAGVAFFGYFFQLLEKSYTP
ncbi:MAG: hypothetical protein WC622_15730, partial [Pedobacter sp.]|uniref:hypothetical protein n=1 Tax=Pedobacter sp. TaxID=1411316 RepID=UPI00356A47E6